MGRLRIFGVPQRARASGKPHPKRRISGSFQVSVLAWGRIPDMLVYTTATLRTAPSQSGAYRKEKPR